MAEDYKELRKVLLDRSVDKLSSVEAFISEVEKYIEEHSNRLLEAADKDEDYDKISAQMASSLASIQAAKERSREMLFHLTTALYHGPAHHVINLMVNDYEN